MGKIEGQEHLFLRRNDKGETVDETGNVVNEKDETVREKLSPEFSAEFKRLRGKYPPTVPDSTIEYFARGNLHPPKKSQREKHRTKK